MAESMMPSAPAPVPASRSHVAEYVAIAGIIGVVGIAAYFMLSGNTASIPSGGGSGGNTASYTVNPTLHASASSVAITGQLDLDGSGYTPAGIVAISDTAGGSSTHTADSNGNFDTGSFDASSTTTVAQTVTFTAKDATTGKTVSTSVVFTGGTQSPTAKPTLHANTTSVLTSGQYELNGSGYTPLGSLTINDNTGGSSTHFADSVGNFDTGMFNASATTEQTETVVFTATDNVTGKQSNTVSVTFVAPSNNNAPSGGGTTPTSSSAPTISVTPSTISYLWSGLLTVNGSNLGAGSPVVITEQVNGNNTAVVNTTADLWGNLNYTSLSPTYASNGAQISVYVNCNNGTSNIATISITGAPSGSAGSTGTTGPTGNGSSGTPAANVPSGASIPSTGSGFTSYASYSNGVSHFAISTGGTAGTQINPYAAFIGYIGPGYYCWVGFYVESSTSITSQSEFDAANGYVNSSYHYIG